MRWIEEIDELHAFFERWFLGTEDSLDRFESVLAPGFTIVGADGREADRAGTIDLVRAARGRSTSLEITISGHRLLHEVDGLLLARYVEEHALADDRTNRRRSTVAFVADPGAPNGLAWLRVHETWCDDAAGA